MTHAPRARTLRWAPALLLTALSFAVGCSGGGHGVTRPRFISVVPKVDGQYIVIFKDEPGLVRPGVIEAVANGFLDGEPGARTLYVYRRTVVGFAARMSPARARVISRDPRVRFVEEDGRVSFAVTAGDGHSQWNLDRVDQELLPLDDKPYAHASSGAGVYAYVIDTGIRIDHAEFGGRATLDYSAFQDGDDTGDGVGHGTHVAGIIGASTHGIAPMVKLHSVRVFPWNEDSTSESAVIAGIEWVSANHLHPAVVNLSLRGQSGNTALDEAVRRSIKNDKLAYVIAASNDAGDACAHTPARVSEAITVAATDAFDKRPKESNYGGCVDLFAPGVQILSTFNASATSTAVMGGTSMAAPHVTGGVARYLQQHPDAEPSAIANELLGHATEDVVGNACPPAASTCESPNKLLYLDPAQ